jgi:2-keto-4-pentenoate hydratase/2-oxohepta-3-ene-1,7-dioic acid hydratase in catechol pathway
MADANRVLEEKLGQRAGDGAQPEIALPPAYYKTPAYYHPDHTTLSAHGDTVTWPAYSDWIDYEFELVAIIGKGGKDIPVDAAEEHIFGYAILNDLSARDAQFAAMASAGLPGKGKDFDGSNPLGPCIVTRDELPDPFARRVEVRVNAEPWVSRPGPTPYWSFAQCIAHASEGQTLRPGMVFSTGCIEGCSATEVVRQLSRGDTVELEMEGLGVLRTHIG